MTMLTWEQFKVKSYDECCYETIVRKLEQKLTQFVEGTKSIQEYIYECNNEARFARHLVDTEEREFDKYRCGLRI